jgi:signal transduction histidine kinase
MFTKVKHAFYNNFSLRLSTSASLVLEKITVNPITVPLPQPFEKYLVTYNNTVRTDTLFNNLAGPAGNTIDSIQQGEEEWRIIKKRILETGGVLTLVYALPAGEYNAAIQEMQVLLLVYTPIAIIISIFAGYFLSGVFLLPLHRIISKANKTDLKESIQLLDEPPVKDEIHELTLALNRMLKRIKAQSQQQQAFFAAASHELRTPLSNMLTGLQTADDRNVTALLGHQIEEVQRLKKLVDDFLLMSRLKAGNMFKHQAKFSVTELLVDIMTSLQQQAAEDRLAFMLNVSPADEDLTILGDKDHFKIIFGNLLVNSVKYASADSVIRISIVKQDNIAITILNKTKIPVTNVDILQEEFTRIEHYQEGLGLGLWIATRLSMINDARLNLYYNNGEFSAVLQVHSFRESNDPK